MCVGDDLDSKYICEPWSTVVSESAKDEVLPLLIEYQYSRQHLEYGIREKYICNRDQAGRGGLDNQWGGLESGPTFLRVKPLKSTIYKSNACVYMIKRVTEALLGK